MKIFRYMCSIGILFFAIAVSSSPARAQQDILLDITLKDNTTISGTLVQKTDRYVSILEDEDEDPTKIYFYEMAPESQLALKDLPTTLPSAIKEETEQEKLRRHEWRSNATAVYNIESALQYASEENWPAALRSADAAITADPTRGEPYQVKGDILQMTGDVEQAVSLYTDAILNDETLVTAYLNRAYAYLTLGNLEACNADLERVLAIEPDNLTALKDLAQTYFERGDLERAKELYLRLIDRTPFQAHMRLALIFIQQEDTENALPHIDGALDIQPKNSELLIYKIQLLADMGKFSKASQLIQKCIDMDIEVPPELHGTVLEAINAEKKAAFEKKLAAEQNLPTYELPPAPVDIRQPLLIGISLLILLIISIIAILLSREPTRPKGLIDPEETPTLLKTEVASPHTIRAGYNKRICAFLIDFAVILAIQTFVFKKMLDISHPALLGLSITILWGLRDSFWGLSIGKFIIGLRVLTYDGKTCSIFQSLARNMPFIVGQISIIYASAIPAISNNSFVYLFMGFGLPFLIDGMEYSFMRLNKEGRRLGDILASTWVDDMRPWAPDWPFFLLWAAFLAVPATIMIKPTGAIQNPHYTHPEYHFHLTIPTGWQSESEDSIKVSLRTNARMKNAKKTPMAKVVIGVNASSSGIPAEKYYLAFSEKLTRDFRKVKKYSITVDDIQGRLFEAHDRRGNLILVVIIKRGAPELAYQMFFSFNPKGVKKFLPGMTTIIDSFEMD